MSGDHSRPEPVFDEDSIRDALDRVTSSQTFEGANRMKAFLTYVVEETLAGRQDMIRAKRIAADVYDRPPDQGAEHDTLVRVDAGRLRRRLALYYSEEGQEDPLRIQIPSGGYAPAFERQNDAVDPPPVDFVAGNGRSPFAAPMVSIVLVAVVAIAAIAVTWGQLSPRTGVAEVDTSRSTEKDAGNARRSAEFSAIFDESPSALQAMAHIKSARDLAFPPMNPARMNSSLELCEMAKRLDPNNSGGYACASRARGFLAYFLDHGERREDLARSARIDAEKAVDLDPTDSHAQSALAWSRFVSGDYDEGMEIARRAVLLDPTDRLSRHHLGLMAVCNGDFNLVLSEQDAGSSFHPFTIARARFHTGSFREAIDMIEETAANQGQTSDFMLAILAASHAQLGDDKRAQRYAGELVRSRPNFADQIRVLYRHPKHAAQFVEPIQAALEKSDSS